MRSLQIQPQDPDIAKLLLGVLVLLTVLIAPGAAAQSGTDALFITDDGDVGLGTDSPGTMAGREARLHLTTSDGAHGGLLVENASTTAFGRAMLELRNNGATRLDQADLSSGVTWRQTNGATRYRLIDLTDPVVVEFDLEQNGDLTISGSLTTAMNTLPDFVFEADYPLMPLSELGEFVTRERHLPGFPSAAEIEQKGRLNISEFQQLLLQKIEELTLYTLSQQEIIDDLRARLAELEQKEPKSSKAATGETPRTR